MHRILVTRVAEKNYYYCHKQNCKTKVNLLIHIIDKSAVKMKRDKDR